MTNRLIFHASGMVLAMYHHWENWRNSYLNHVLCSVVQMRNPGWERLTRVPVAQPPSYPATSSHTACLQKREAPVLFYTCLYLQMLLLRPAMLFFFLSTLGLLFTLDVHTILSLGASLDFAKQSFPWSSLHTFRAHLTTSSRFTHISVCFTRMWALEDTASKIPEIQWI